MREARCAVEDSVEDPAEGARLRSKARVRAKSVKTMTAVSCAVVMIVAGALYVVLASFHNNRLHAQAVDLYQDQFDVGVAGDSQQLVDARSYNDELTARPFSPPPIGRDSGHDRWGEYRGQLSSANDVMATLTLPRQNIALPVYHGTSGEVLNKGAGHLFGSHLPVGSGVDGQSRDRVGLASAISAHTGLFDKPMFDNVQHMEVGDYAIVQVAGTKVGYKKVSDKTVPPDATNALEKTPGKDILYLITCTPYGLNFDRLVVALERISDEELASLSPEDVQVDQGLGDNVSGMTLALVPAVMVVLLLWVAYMVWEWRLRKTSYAFIDDHFDGVLTPLGEDVVQVADRGL